MLNGEDGDCGLFLFTLHQMLGSKEQATVLLDLELGLIWNLVSFSIMEILKPALKLCGRDIPPSGPENIYMYNQEVWTNTIN